MDHVRLNGDEIAQIVTPGEIDDAHPALAKNSFQTIWAEFAETI